MIEDIRKTALAHAMELARLRCGGEASSIVKDASVFEAYLSGGDFFSINDSNRLNIGGSDKFPRERLSGGGVASSKLLGDNFNQSLSGGYVSDSTHNKNSSHKENNCDLELPTPSSTETVDPSSGTVTDQGTHGRTDGGA